MASDQTGAYFFVSSFGEIIYVGWSSNLKKRLVKSHEKYDNESVLVIPTRKFMLAQGIKAVFAPLMDCKRNVVKILYGKKGR